MDRSEYLIRIIVQAVNQAGNFGDRAAEQVEKITRAQGRQTESAKKTQTSIKDLDAEYTRFVNDVKKGNKSYDDAIFGLKRFRAEMDKLARAEPPGSKMAESLNRSSVASKNLHDQIVRANKVEQDLARSAAADHTRREVERQNETQRTIKQEQRAEADGVKNRRGLMQDLLDEVRRDHNERMGFAKELADFEVKEAVRVESNRQSSGSSRPHQMLNQTQRPLGERIRSMFSRDEPAVRRFTEVVDKVRGSSEGAAREVERVGAAAGRMGGRMDKAGFSIAKVDNNLRGLMVIGIIGFAQQLISAIVGLAGALVAVASAAAQAGAALGGAFVAAGAQALPVIGLLASAFQRVTTIFKDVALFNKQQAKSGYDQSQIADKQAAANDAIASAQEQVVSSTRRVHDATEALTAARERALQNIQDLNIEERKSSLSKRDASEALRRAASQGDVGALEGLRISRDEASLQQPRVAGQAVSARRAGVGSSTDVKQAMQTLDDSNKALEQARRGLDAANRSAASASKNTSFADRTLEQALAQLTPAELALYETGKRVQQRFHEVFRPITDIIIRSFDDALKGVGKLMGDKRITGSFTLIATQIASSIHRIFKFLTDTKGIAFFQQMAHEAARNLPLITTLVIKMGQLARNIASAAGPALHRFIQFFVDLASKGAKATGSDSGLARLRRFFLEGEKMAESFTKLGISLIQLFLAVAGQGGAKGGQMAVDDLTAAIKRATDWVLHHGPQVKKFFHDSMKVAYSLAGAVLAIGKAMVSVFRPDSVTSFVKVFKDSLLPALTSSVTILGNMTTIMLKFLSLPGVSQMAALALSVGLVFKAFSTLGRLVGLLADGKMVSLLTKIPKVGAAIRVLTVLIRGAAIAMTGPWGLAIAAIVAGIVLLNAKFHFLGPTFRWLKQAGADAFKWLKDAAGDVVRFFTDSWNHGLLKVLAFPFVEQFKLIKLIVGEVIPFLTSLFSGGKFKGISGLIAAPFKIAWGIIKIAWDIISGIVNTALDLIRGDFKGAGDDLTGMVKSIWDEIKGVFKEGVDFVLGLLTTFLGGISSVGSAIGGLGIPVVSDAFKGAADAIDGARSSLDGYRASLRGSHDDHRKQIASTAELADQMTKLRTKLRGLRKGTSEYDDTASALKDKQKELNRSMADAKSAGTKGSKGVLAIGNAALSASKVADAAFGSTVGSFNKLAKQFGGIKEIHFSADSAKIKPAQGGGGIIDEAAITRANGGWGPRIRRALGGYGWIGGQSGGPQGPDKVPVLAGANEAFLSVKQQGPVEEGLAMRSMVKGGPSSLDHLFRMTGGAAGRMFATGGRVFAGLKAGISSLVNKILQRFPGLSVTSTTGGHHAPGSLHYVGEAADLGGPASMMNRAARWLAANGRSLTEGIHNPGLSVKDGHGVPSSFWGAKTWSEHADHIHVAIAGLLGKLGLGGGAGGTIKTPRIHGPEGLLHTITQRAVSRIARAARRHLDRGSFGSTGAEGKFPVTGSGNAAQVRRWLAAGLKLAGQPVTGAAISTLFGRTMQESGGDPNIVNTTDSNARAGHPSIGLLQTIQSTFDQYKVRGHNNIRNPVDNAAAAIRYMLATYGHLVGTSSTGYQHGGRVLPGYAAGGELPGAPGQAVPIMAHAREWILNDAHKSRMAGWLGVGVDQLRSMLGLSVGRTSAASGTEVVGRKLAPQVGYSSPDLDPQDEPGIMREIGVIRASIRRLRSRSSGFVKAFERSIRLITDDGGLIDQGKDAVQHVVDKLALRLKRMTFKIKRDGSVVQVLTPAQQNAAALGGIDAQIGGLKDVRAGAAGSLSDVNKQLAKIARGGVSAKERKAYDSLLTARRGLTSKIDELDASIADAVQSRFAAQEQILQDTIDQVNKDAQSKLTSADLGDRFASMAQYAGDAAGAFAIRASDINTRISAQTDQRNALQPLLDQATAQGSTSIAADLATQIADLSVSIAENTQAISANTTAARQAAIDSITQRGGFLGGVFGGLSGIVQSLGAASGTVDLAQIAALAAQAQTVLKQTGDALTQQLLEGYGVNLTGLGGQGLVSALSSLNYDGIEANFTTDQRAQFESLIGAIIDNAGAVNQNTQQIEQANAIQEQSFSTTAWQLFRSAIFDGSGGLLPSYNLPSMATGGSIMAGGMAPSSPTSKISSVTPRSAAGGDHIEVNVTTPTEVLDPGYLAQVISHRRPLERAS